jgi:hypothetical protein
MQVKIYKNFLSKEECEVLNKVAIQGVNEGWIDKGVQDYKTGYDKRLTSRMHMGKAEYPQIVRDISTRVRKFVKVDLFPIIDGHGKDGVVVSYTVQDGAVYKHKDPRSNDGLPTYRCNILTQANEDGCNLYVDGQKIDIEVGDLHCYLVSELQHYVTEAKGETPRIMWMFGAHIPKEHWSEYGLSRVNT